MKNHIKELMEYKSKLEKLLKFRELIENKSGKTIIKVNKDDKYIKNLRKNIELFIKEFNGGDILKDLNHSAKGLQIESLFKIFLNRKKKVSFTPRNNEGKRQSTGYPDMYIQDKDNKNDGYYLEIKVYGKQTLNSTARTFYDNISKNYKILKTTNHILLGFEVNSSGINDYTLIDLYNLDVKIKLEVNSSNKYIYNNKNTIER